MGSGPPRPSSGSTTTPSPTPEKTPGGRARAWILRARLDWFTAAYTEPQHATRLTRLIALMDNLGIDHGGHVDQTTLQATTQALERQAQGIATDPAHADFAQETLQFLALTHHLDQSAPYFDAINALRRATPPPGAMSAQPNALIVALVDLHHRPHTAPHAPPRSPPTGARQDGRLSLS